MKQNNGFQQFQQNVQKQQQYWQRAGGAYWLQQKRRRERERQRIARLNRLRSEQWSQSHRHGPRPGLQSKFESEWSPEFMADFTERPAPAEEHGGCLSTIGRGISFILKLVVFLIILSVVLSIIA